MSTRPTSTRSLYAWLRDVILVVLLSSDLAQGQAATSETPTTKPTVSAQVQGVQNGLCNNTVICIVWGTPTISPSQSGMAPADPVHPPKSQPVTKPPKNRQKGKSSGEQRARSIGVSCQPNHSRGAVVHKHR